MVIKSFDSNNNCKPSRREIIEAQDIHYDYKTFIIPRRSDRNFEWLFRKHNQAGDSRAVFLPLVPTAVASPLVDPAL